MDARLACPNLPSGIPTQCVNLVDEDRVPLGPRVCSANLAPELPPNPFGFSQVWGPCDFDGILPGCGPDLECGIIGDARYRDDYIEALLEDFGHDVSNARWHGFCFPTCGDLCDPTPCGDPEGSTCEIAEGAAQCACLPGFEADDDGLCAAAGG